MSNNMFGIMTSTMVPVLIILFIAIFIVKQYRRCPSNKIMVIFGRMTGNQSARCIHGGGYFLIPLLQDYAFLSLEPMTLEIDLKHALSLRNIRVNVPSTFTIGISTKEEIRHNAAERLLGLTNNEISLQAQNIILGQMRLIIATLSIEEINQDREKFLDLVNKNVNLELHKVGLEVINVNVTDITDESGYIEAIGKKAAAEAINKAKVEVAQQEKDGAVGEAAAKTEKEVKVSEQHSKMIQGQKSAEQEKRIAIAHLESEAVKGENESKARMAEYESELRQRQAEAQRTGEVALANASRDVLISQKEEEVARLEKSELAQKEVNKKKVEIDAEAEAERVRIIAKGEADAIMLKYSAEAEGTRKVLEAKALGYKDFISVVGENNSNMVPTLLLVEQMPELIEQQVKAIQALKIDKITIWDNGGRSKNENGATANFLKDIINVLPPIHDLAKQVGIELPSYFGKLKMEDSSPVTSRNGDDSEISEPII